MGTELYQGWRGHLPKGGNLCACHGGYPKSACPILFLNLVPALENAMPYASAILF